MLPGQAAAAEDGVDEEMEHQDGKRVADSNPSNSGRKKGSVGLIAAAAAAAAVLGAYLGVCAFASSYHKILPNTAVAGVDVGRMTLAEAGQRLDEQLPQVYGESAVTFLCDGKEYQVSGKALQADGAASAQIALEQSLPRGFFSAGTRYIGALLSRRNVAPVLSFPLVPDGVADALKDSTDPHTHTEYEITQDAIRFTKGTTGRTIDAQALMDQILDCFARKDYSTRPEIDVITAPPAQPDFDAIYNEVFVPKGDAYFDKDSGVIVAEVTGVSFNKETAAQTVANAAEGSVVSVPLIFDEPEVTYESLNAVLFKDVLGTSTTTCAGPKNRWANIALAASRVDGTILMPGEEFSYNDTCGPYTKAGGYLNAGTYQNGQSVDATAGGICQMSSTLYWSTLKANLEIVERSNHSMWVGYLQRGCDATVFGSGPDFRFKNNSEHPIKLTAYMTGTKLTVTITGTNTTGNYVVIEDKTVSVNPMEIVYKADETVPEGSEPVRNPAYPGHDGLVVDVYRVLYDKDGNLISRTQESRSRYAKQNKEYRVNPADLWKYTGGTPPEPTPTPSDVPVVLPTPVPSDVPVVTPTPGPGGEPVVPPTPTPAPTPELPVPTPGMEPIDTPQGETQPDDGDE